MNPFDTPLAARLYAEGRPFHHPRVADLMRPHLPRRVPRALDVACGTGLSTRILLEFAEEVTGCDGSRCMLDAAFQDPRITYVCAPATAMPFGDESFGLITLGSGLHWFAAEAFLGEAARLLSPGGHLVVYDHAFTGGMTRSPAYAEWHHREYLTRFPPPPRASATPDAAALRRAGLEQTCAATFESDLPFSPAGLASYLLTQSNVLAALQDFRLHVEDVRAWIIAGVSSTFRLPAESFRFAGTVMMYRRTGSRPELPLCRREGVFQ